VPQRCGDAVVGGGAFRRFSHIPFRLSCDACPKIPVGQ
jgi:hypothetical protein